MTRRPVPESPVAPSDLDARRELRDQAADEREAAADMHDALSLQRDLDVEQLLAGAQKRDDAAAKRDVSAEVRDAAAASRGPVQVDDQVSRSGMRPTPRVGIDTAGADLGPGCTAVAMFTGGVVQSAAPRRARCALVVVSGLDRG